MRNAGANPLVAVGIPILYAPVAEITPKGYCIV